MRRTGRPRGKNNVLVYAKIYQSLAIFESASGNLPQEKQLTQGGREFKEKKAKDNSIWRKYMLVLFIWKKYLPVRKPILEQSPVCRLLDQRDDPLDPIGQLLPLLFLEQDLLLGALVHQDISQAKLAPRKLKINLVTFSFYLQSFLLFCPNIWLNFTYIFKRRKTFQFCPIFMKIGETSLFNCQKIY